MGVGVGGCVESLRSGSGDAMYALMEHNIKQLFLKEDDIASLVGIWKSDGGCHNN